MTIDEAIRTLEQERERIWNWSNLSRKTALSLGLEALRRVKADRSLPYPIVSDPLPGETLPPRP